MAMGLGGRQIQLTKPMKEAPVVERPVIHMFNNEPLVCKYREVIQRGATRGRGGV